jgi:quercetin dioxygenase-like cupin family protein
MSSAVIRQQGEGERLWFAGGGVFTMKATAAETGDAFVLWEDTMVQGKTTPLHTHPDSEEAFYVLEGELLVHVDGEDHTVATGGFFLAPRGVPHAFMVTSETARVLSLVTPGAAEAFFRDASDPVGAANDDMVRPPDFARLRAAAERSASIEILGPPPFAAAGQPSPVQA